MATEVLMPKLGLTMTEGTIEEWKFKEGDAVKKGDILFSVATDKLTNDVEAEEDGVLLKILLPGSAPPVRRCPTLPALRLPPLLLQRPLPLPLRLLPPLLPLPRLLPARRPSSLSAAAPAAMWLPSVRLSWAPR